MIEKSIREILARIFFPNIKKDNPKIANNSKQD